jgi:hypothetical protein
MKEPVKKQTNMLQNKSLTKDWYPGEIKNFYNPKIKTQSTEW